MGAGEGGSTAAAFETELGRLAAAAADAFEVTGSARDPQGLRLRARTDDGFDVEVRCGDDAVEVRLGGWRHREALGDPEDAEEVLDAALDLVASAMWGKILLREIRAGDRPWRWTPIFVGPSGGRALSSTGGGILGWRPRTTTLEHINRASPPAGMEVGEGGAMPSRPWIGVRRGASLQGARELPLDGELDLHPFSPKEVKPLVLAYIEACREKDVLSLRIVHGKGIGHLRRTVHAILSRHEAVVSYRLGGHGEGSWGATIVQLRARDG